MKKGWLVTMAGLGLNLALGVLYAWSMFSKQLTETIAKGGFGWTRTTATLPYTIAIAFFALVMIPAGRLQDKLGPRVIATAGAVLCGAGLVVASFGRADLVWPVILGFGVLAGTGIGLGYAAATPAAVKWFGPEKKGLITGIVVAGFGLAPVYIAPLSKALLHSRGVGGAFRILGFVFLVVAGLSAQFLKNPKPGYIPVRSVPAKAKKAKTPPLADATWREMIRTPRFWSLYLQFACGATAGLMIIGHVAKIVATQSGGAIQAGFLFVALMAVFNATGRVAAGVVSDIIGRVGAMIIVFLIQASIMFFFDQFTTTAGFLFGAALVGLQLRRLPVALSGHGGRLLGHEEPRPQLRDSLHRLGRRRRFRTQPGRDDRRCHGELCSGLPGRRRPLAVRGPVGDLESHAPFIQIGRQTIGHHLGEARPISNAGSRSRLIPAGGPA